jgi:hypothetical protein
MEKDIEKLKKYPELWRHLWGLIKALLKILK